MRHYVLNVMLIVGMVGSVSPLRGMVDLDLSEFSQPGMAPGQATPEMAQQGATPGPAPLQTAPATGTAQPGASQPLVWQDQSDAIKEVGVTTINESRGNWFFKNKIGKDARKLNDKINKKVSALLPLQEKYLNERATIDTALNEFYREYGVKKGEIEDQLNIVLADLKRLEATTSPLDDQEKVLLADAKKKKEEIGALQNDFDILQKLEDGLSKALVTMSAQLTKANAYSDQAWDFYEKIEDTLSDEAAEDLLNRIQTLFDNVTAIETYLTGEFRNYFTATSQKIMQNVQNIKQRITTLKQQGVVLGQKMRDLIDAENKIQQEQDAQKLAKKQKEAELANRSWLSLLFKPVSWVFGKIGDMFVYVYESITGLFVSKKVPKKAEPVKVEPLVEQAPEQPAQELSEQKPSETRPEAPVVEPVAAPEMPVMPTAPTATPVQVPQQKSMPQMPNKPLIPVNPVPQL